MPDDSKFITITNKDNTVQYEFKGIFPGQVRLDFVSTKIEYMALFEYDYEEKGELDYYFY